MKNRNELWFLNIISPGIFFTCIQEPGVVYPVWYGWVPNQSGTAGPCHVQDGTPGCPQVVELAREIFHENYRYQYLFLVAVPIFIDDFLTFRSKVKDGKAIGKIFHWCFLEGFL